MTSIIEVPDESEVTAYNLVAMNLKELQNELGVLPMMANSEALPKSNSKLKVMISHKESCNIVEGEEEVHINTKSIKNPHRTTTTINDLVKQYKP
jgi:hypothetical protein